jgi:hypothetical protein
MRSHTQNARISHTHHAPETRQSRGQQSVWLPVRATGSPGPPLSCVCIFLVCRPASSYARAGVSPVERARAHARTHTPIPPVCFTRSRTSCISSARLAGLRHFLMSRSRACASGEEWREEMRIRLSSAASIQLSVHEPWPAHRTAMRLPQGGRVGGRGTVRG